MVICFWFSTFLLWLCALGFIRPHCFSVPKDILKSVGMVFVLVGLSYSLYFHLGSSQFLTHYYSPTERLSRLRGNELRALLAEFKKEEFRLKLRLEENSKDKEAEWRLLDVLAIKALQQGDKAHALAYWEEALNKMPPELKPQFKEKISNFIPRR